MTAIPQPLVSLLRNLAERGIDLGQGATSDTLRVGPREHLDDDLRERLKTWKPRLLELLELQRLDVAERVELMGRYGTVAHGLPHYRGWCFSCWAVLPDRARYGRCPVCQEAYQRVLAMMPAAGEVS